MHFPRSLIKQSNVFFHTPETMHTRTSDKFPIGSHQSKPRSSSLPVSLGTIQLRELYIVGNLPEERGIGPGSDSAIDSFMRFSCESAHVNVKRFPPPLPSKIHQNCNLSTVAGFITGLGLGRHRAIARKLSCPLFCHKFGQNS